MSDPRAHSGTPHGHVVGPFFRIHPLTKKIGACTGFDRGLFSSPILDGCLCALFFCGFGMISRHRRKAPWTCATEKAILVALAFFIFFLTPASSNGSKSVHVDASFPALLGVLVEWGASGYAFFNFIFWQSCAVRAADCVCDQKGPSGVARALDESGRASTVLPWGRHKGHLKRRVPRA